MADYSMVDLNQSQPLSDGTIVSTVGLDSGSTGTGAIDPFLVLQATGNNALESGYNTDAASNALPLDDKIANETRSILLSSMQAVNVGGTLYYEFLLDANETGKGSDNKYVSLSQFQLYTSADPAQNGETVSGTLQYTMPSSILIDSSSSGSGNGYDLKILVPVSSIIADPTQPYLILYTQFGGAYNGPMPNGIQVDYGVDAGFEEWTTKVSTFVADPVISIQKVTGDAADVLAGGDSYTFLTGTAIVWTYIVKNTGNVDLSSVVLTDNKENLALVSLSGDTNNDHILSVGEAWTYTLAGAATANQYNNTGTVHANYNGADVTASDDSGYFGAQTGVKIDKFTISGTGHGDGLKLLTGSAVTWEYDVTNTGNVALSGISVSDNQLLPGSVQYVSGDNGNGVLDANETWIYQANGTAIHGSYSNTGTVTGSFTDSAGNISTPSAHDDSSYVGVTPHITLDKVTQGVDQNGQSHTGDGINIQAGTQVTWLYTLTNDGDVPLSFDKALGLVDDGGPNPDFIPTFMTGDIGSDGILGVGEVWTFKAPGIATPGDYANNAKATAGAYQDDGGHTAAASASDSSNYHGIFVEDDRARTQGFWQGVADAWDNVGNNEAKSTLSKFASGELRDYSATDSILNVNATGKGSPHILIGDENGNGITDPNETTLKIDISVAKNILASATTGDARIIMLEQTIAAQLNIDNGVKAPTGLITEAVQWLKGAGSWAGFVNLDTNHDGIIDENTAKTALAGTAVSTSSNAWHKYVDVTENNLTDNVTADGEGLKNALMWFNDGHLVVDKTGNFVAWDADGHGGSTTVANWQFNSVENYWQTLHLTDQLIPLTGIS